MEKEGIAKAEGMVYILIGLWRCMCGAIHRNHRCGFCPNVF